ncbi:hypothetical protein CTAYLR_008117 [Chrysophaeum taylorii]|uniref:Exonuclease domain-containing protein n=1 Tax=Chrysophaeum taylorii TaxID=2483200 RepID=A0AAD7UKQ2_9STRA|nr:hypothetical protein CTAYLR_008117 [Chrysophaeum taylorii]
MGDEVEKLRAQLKAQEEANEILSLRAELAKVQQEREALLAGEEASPAPTAKKKARRGKKKARASYEEGEIKADDAKADDAKADEAKADEVEAKAVEAAADEAKAPKRKDESEDESAKKKRRVASVLAGLPVASQQDKPKKEKEKEKSSEPFMSRWSVLVRSTKASLRFKTDRAKLCEEADGSWARAKPCGPWCADLPHAFALDCEMCVCQDPVTKTQSNRELVRLSIIDADSRDVALDTLVAPSLPVVDYVTRIHGIDETALRGVTFTRRHAQAALLALVCDRTVVVGHALCNDFAALRFHHDCCVDTSCVFACSGGETPGLRDVAHAVLTAEQRQDYAENAHDSIVDARTSLLCALAAVSDTFPVVIPRADPPVAKKATNGVAAADTKDHLLFVHRIPSDFDCDALTKAFEPATGVHVLSAIFVPGTPYGKCTLSLKSKRHADLAFDVLGPASDEDKQGRPQKKLFLNAASKGHPANGAANHSGPYCKIRKF